MFGLASIKISGRRILVIESISEVAAELRAVIGCRGGVALGPTACIDDALCYIATVGNVDCIMLDTRLAATTTRLIPDLFKDRGIETIFVTGHDEWFDDDEDDDGTDEFCGADGLMMASA